MPRYRIWRYDSETAYTEVEAPNEDDALELIQDGDQDFTWTGTRYDADYDVEDVAKIPSV